jgi:aryl-alcohol dehydrogenase-like predicted oxidoreductase
MKYRQLGSTGLNLSVIGFGAAPLGNEFGPVDVAETERAIHQAIDRGINFFDVAPYYGRTLAEERLGPALAGKRDQIVLSSKCGRYDTASFDFSAARVKTSIDESLRRLRTDHLDLFIAHDIEFGDREQVIQETIPAMRELQQAGKVRYIGISGLPLKILADVAERGKVDFVLSYCHYNLMERDLDVWLTPVLEKHQMGLINAAAVHLRILTNAGPIASHPAPEAVKKAGAEVVRLCESRGVNPAILSLAFSLGHPYAASTLCGMSNVDELEQNLSALNITPDAELLAEIDQILAPLEHRVWPSGRIENRDF